jgi:hypothetical protein
MESTPCPVCTTPAIAWELVAALAEAALDGDDDAARCLGHAAEHYLQIERWARREP